MASKREKSIQKVVELIKGNLADNFIPSKASLKDIELVTRVYLGEDLPGIEDTRLYNVYKFEYETVLDLLEHYFED